MKKNKFPLTASLSLILTALSSTHIAFPSCALAVDPTFAEQRDAQMALSRDRIQQIRQQLDRVGTSVELYPQDYIVASRALLDSVEISLTAFDAKVLEIMSRFEGPIVEYNQIASSALSDAQKAIRLLPLDQQIDRLKVQASEDYSKAIKELYDLIPGLPHLAKGSILYSNATAAQKASMGCPTETRHILKASFTNSKGQELFIGHQCVKASETSTAFPYMAPLSEQVREQFYNQVLTPMLSQHCQSEVCKQFLLLDYASVLQKVGVNIDKDMTLGFGRNTFTIQIPLANPDVVTRLVGAILISSSIPSQCQTDLSEWWDRPALGTVSADGSISPMEYSNAGRLVSNAPRTNLEKYRSRADLTVNGAAHLLNLIPVIGQILYNIHPDNYNSGILSNNSENSAAWRGNQIIRTLARCNDELDQNYGGDRDRYTCLNDGWRHVGPRHRMRRERFNVYLQSHDPIVHIRDPKTNYDHVSRIYTNEDPYIHLFSKQLEASRACLARD